MSCPATSPRIRSSASGICDVPHARPAALGQLGTVLGLVLVAVGIPCRLVVGLVGAQVVLGGIGRHARNVLGRRTPQDAANIRPAVYSRRDPGKRPLEGPGGREGDRGDVRDPSIAHAARRDLARRSGRRSSCSPPAGRPPVRAPAFRPRGGDAYRERGGGRDPDTPPDARATSDAPSRDRPTCPRTAPARRGMSVSGSSRRDLPHRPVQARVRVHHRRRALGEQGDDAGQCRPRIRSTSRATGSSSLRIRGR